MASKVPHQSSETHIPRGINVCSRCARLAADILSKPLTAESIRSEEIPWQMMSGRGERTFSVDYIPKNVRSCALCSLISNEGRWVTFGEADPFLRIEFFVPADGCEPNGFRGTSSVLKGLAGGPLSFDVAAPLETEMFEFYNLKGQFQKENGCEAYINEADVL